MSMKDGPFKRAYLQIRGATGWATFEKVWELLKHTLYDTRVRLNLGTNFDVARNTRKKSRL